jgi:hypothetical protein
MKYVLSLVIALSAGVASLHEAPSAPPPAAPPGVDIGPAPWLTEAWQEVSAEDDDPHTGLDVAESGMCTRSDEVEEGDLGDDDEYASDVHATHGAAGFEPDPHGQRRAPEVAAGAVTRSSASNGFTIADLFEQRSALAGRRVSLRATVVRRMDGVLGKTFLHLQDGTGSPERANYDLAATTSDELPLGETVEIEGELKVDQELGIGYTYSVLLTDARRIELR